MLRTANLLLASLALAGLAALAGPAGAESSAANWDDSHMRSNFARQRGPAPPRPPVQGSDRFHQAAEAPAPTPPTTVAETTLHLNPHGWEPGAGAGARNATPPWASPGNGGHGSSSARPSASAGVRSGVPGLHASSLGSQRSRR
jgi:hypothetical protein